MLINKTTFPVNKGAFNMLEFGEKEINVSVTMQDLVLSRKFPGVVPMHYMIDYDKSDLTVLVSNTIKSLKEYDCYDYTNMRTVRAGSSHVIDKKDGSVIIKKNHSILPAHIQTSQDFFLNFIKNSFYKKLSLNEVTASMLSGGIDSVISTYLAKSFNSDIVAYTFLVEGQESENSDLKHAINAAKILDVPLQIVQVSGDEILECIDDIIYITEDTKDYNIYSATGAYFLLKKVREDGHKFVVCGEGPDEIFGTYDSWGSHQLSSQKASQPEYRCKFVNNLDWNLSRGTKVANYLGVDLFSPFLNSEFINLAVNIPSEVVHQYGHRKGILAKAFEDVLPLDLLLRPKVRFQDGSGVTPILRKAGVDNAYIKRVYDLKFK